MVSPAPYWGRWRCASSHKLPPASTAGLTPYEVRLAYDGEPLDTLGDLPLALSQQVHGYPRLGQASNDFSKLAGVEVIDLSELSIGDPTGHLYHIYSPEFGADLDRLLNEDARAGDREGLRQVGPNRWLMEPSAQ